MCFDADARPPDLPADLVRGMAGGAKAELADEGDSLLRFVAGETTGVVEFAT